MKFTPLILAIACLTSCLATAASAQETYLTGTARQSIEPESYPFSVSLAGYGVPRGGRFSIKWNNPQPLNGSKAITGNATALFSLANGSLFSRQAGQHTWINLGAAADIEMMTAADQALYAVDKMGNLLSSGLKQKLNWKKIGRAENATAIAVLDHVLYVAHQDGSVTAANLKGQMSWKKSTQLPGLISLLGYKGRLLALTAKDELMHFDPNNNSGWIKIAAFNGFSYAIHLKSIAVSQDRLYGLDKTDQLFESAHQSDGNLSVRAVAIQSKKQQVILVGTDLCGFNHDFISSIKKEIYKKHGIPDQAILINASHTHFAPSTQDWTTWGNHQLPDSVYLNQVVKPAMISTIEGALKNRKPTFLSFGRGKTAIGKNRRFKGPNPAYDNDVDVLQLENVKDHTKSLVFLAGCHPVFKNEGAEGFTLSANYPAVARDVLEKELGIKESIFIQGCGGDINPVSLKHRQTGTDLAADVKAVLAGPMQPIKGEINFHLDSINFPVNRWSNARIQAFRKENDNGKGDIEAERNVRWADLMLKQDREGKMLSSMPVYLQTLNIGNWKLVGLSRETVTDYSIGIKKLWPDKLVSVAGYCNDVSSYLPTSAHIKSGFYEGLGSFFWYGQPNVFPLEVYDTIIERVKTNNH